jgi:hypothetical protein
LLTPVMVSHDGSLLGAKGTARFFARWHAHKLKSR